MQSLESLAAKAQDGDQECLAQLSKQVREPLRVFLISRLGSDADADDVAQETLLRAFEHLESYDPNRPFKTWIFTIGKRLAINHVRSAQARRARDGLPIEEEGEPPVDPNLGIWTRAKEVLSEEAYRAIWMRYIQEDSVKEVANALGRTQVSTKVLLFRARKKLMRDLDL